MKSCLLLVCFLVFTSHQLELEQIFDVNDVENQACQVGCKPEKVRWATETGTYEELHRCAICTKLMELCVAYRTCQDNCVPQMPVLPYEQARDFAKQVRPPMNPCLELISACNYESMDSYQTLRSENPFLFT